MVPLGFWHPSCEVGVTGCCRSSSNDGAMFGAAAKEGLTSSESIHDASAAVRVVVNLMERS